VCVWCGVYVCYYVTQFSEKHSLKCVCMCVCVRVCVCECDGSRYGRQCVCESVLCGWEWCECGNVSVCIVRVCVCVCVCVYVCTKVGRCGR
jgi:hypothetical protein